MHERGDFDGDGHVDFTGDSTATYDKHGLLVSSLGTFSDPSGTFSSSQVYTRDKAGNAVKIVSEESSNGVLLDRARAGDVRQVQPSHHGPQRTRPSTETVTSTPPT